MSSSIMVAMFQEIQFPNGLLRSPVNKWNTLTSLNARELIINELQES